MNVNSTYENDLAACRQAIRKGSKSFHAASLILPKSVREGAYALYAFCRYSDDIIDLGGGDAQAIAKLQERLAGAYANAPEDSPVDRAFAWVVRAYAIPKTLPAALIEGLAWDTDGRRYETIEDLHDYCARVAGSVGAMMAVLMGAREKDAIARACDLGVAMQLTNIARDVGEDARAGRVYLPLQWLCDAEIDVERFLAAPAFTPALGRVVKRLLDEAAHYYERGLAGVDFLPMRCRAGIVAAADIYGEIGRRVAENGYDSISRRAVVPTRRKLTLLASAIAGPNFAYAPSGDAPLPANAFLVDAVEPARGMLTENTASSAEQVLNLMMRLERRDRADAPSV
ncbi:MAG: phytoene/squalene synthase family protein [Pseudomonadota bacterium]